MGILTRGILPFCRAPSSANVHEAEVVFHRSCRLVSRLTSPSNWMSIRYKGEPSLSITREMAATFMGVLTSLFRSKALKNASLGSVALQPANTSSVASSSANVFSYWISSLHPENKMAVSSDVLLPV